MLIPAQGLLCLFRFVDLCFALSTRFNLQCSIRRRAELFRNSGKVLMTIGQYAHLLRRVFKVLRTHGRSVSQRRWRDHPHTRWSVNALLADSSSISKQGNEEPSKHSRVYTSELPMLEQHDNTSELPVSSMILRNNKKVGYFWDQSRKRRQYLNLCHTHYYFRYKYNLTESK